MYKSLNKSAVISILLIALFNNTALADTHIAASCAHTDVNAAITAASDGDTVSVPAGTCDWGTDYITFSKAIKIVGAGYGAGGTTISSANGTYGFFSISTGNSRSFPFSLSGFRFNTTYATSGGRILYITGAGYNWRIYNNYFYKAEPNAALNLYMTGGDGTHTLFGLIDSNILYNVKILINGSSNYSANSSWMAPAQWGTDQAVFIENNNFYGPVPSSGSRLDSNGGARIVFRYNNLYDARIEAHSACESSVRGVRSYEIYNNRFMSVVTTGTWAAAMALRGGSHVIVRNVIAGDGYDDTGKVALDNRRSSFDSSCTSGFGNADGMSQLSLTYDTFNANPLHIGTPNGMNLLPLDGIGAGTGPIGSQTVDPVYIWENTSERICRGGSNAYRSCTSDSDCPGSTCTTQVNTPNFVYRRNDTNYSPYQIIANRNYFENTARPGWTPYTCPHPLAGAGSCNTGVAGTSGYSLSGGPAPVPDAFALSTSVSGSGTITSSPAGISCGADCSESYATGTYVTLTATANSGYTFAGWSGACTGTGSCVVSMTSNKAVAATFTQNAVYYTLSASKTGSGSLTSTPSGISCGSDCSESYVIGTSVTVTAAAATGYTFTGWSGACTGTGACTISMTAAKSVAATFTQNKTYYTLSATKSGNGTVASTPAGISCGADCSESYESGASVALTATADSGYTFTGWSGACTGTGDCTVTMNAAKTVAATFTQNATYYTLTTNNSGNGTITSSPAGINCGATCAYSYESGTAVTLTITPNTGYTFSGWSGACTGTDTCQVTMDTAKSVTATFAVSATNILSVKYKGKGRIRSKLAIIPSLNTPTNTGIDCGDICVEEYASETTVTLEAIPDTGYTFAGWSGACSGAGECVVTVNATTSVEAIFNSTSGSSTSDILFGGFGGGGGGGGGGCFIATAAYGSYLDPHVMVLRNFRDNILMKNDLGRAFVKYYYRNSPAIAEKISKTEGLKIVTRLALTPIVYAMAYPIIAAMLLLAAILMLVVVLSGRRKKTVKLTHPISEIHFEHGPRKAFVRVK